MRGSVDKGLRLSQKIDGNKLEMMLMMKKYGIMALGGKVLATSNTVPNPKANIDKKSHHTNQGKTKKSSNSAQNKNQATVASKHKKSFHKQSTNPLKIEVDQMRKRLNPTQEQKPTAKNSKERQGKSGS